MPKNKGGKLCTEELNSQQSDVGENPTVDFLSSLRRSPCEFLQEFAKKRGQCLRFERQSPICQSLWTFCLTIHPKDKQILLKCPWKSKRYIGKGLFEDHDQAMNSVSTYALFKMKSHWKLWERLTEPYRTAYMKLVENEKDRKLDERIAQKSRKESKDYDLEETCSLGSFNTGFSCKTEHVSVKPSPHFVQRVKERHVTLRQQQLCLKYGLKAPSVVYQNGTPVVRTKFQLGGIQIIQAGPEQGNVAVTVIRPIHNERGSFIEGEVLEGVIVSITGDIGFIETYKGRIFFTRGDTDRFKMPDLHRCRRVIRVLGASFIGCIFCWSPPGVRHGPLSACTA